MLKRLILLTIFVSLACSESGFQNSGSKKTAPAGDDKGALSEEVSSDDEVAENPANITGVFLTLYTVQEPTDANPESKVGIVMLDESGKKDTSRSYAFTTDVPDYVTGEIKNLKASDPYHAYQIVGGDDKDAVIAAVKSSRVTAQDRDTNETASVSVRTKKSTPIENEQEDSSSGSAPGDFDLPTGP